MAKSNQTQQLINKFEEARKGYEYIKGDLIVLEYGYLNKIPDEKLKELRKRGKSTLAPKKIFAKIRRIVISIMKTYFENDEFAKLLPIYDNDYARQQVQILQKVFDFWINKKINLYTRLRPIVKDGLVYGTGCAKVFWRNGLKIERVNLHDIWVDPNAENIFDIQYVVNRVYTTIATLKKQFGNKKIFRNLIGATIENDEPRFSDADLGDASRIEVYDIYTLENGKWYVSTMLPTYQFIRVKEELKDGLPFVFGIAETQFVCTGEMAVRALGYPIVDLMIPLQEQYTITINQQFDAIDKQLNPQFLATKQAGISENTLRSNKKLLQVTDLNNIRELPQPNINQSLLATDKVELDMQEVSGITKLSQGIIDKHQNTTATGMTILTQEANEVIADIIRSFNESFFEPLIRRMVRLIYKYDDNPMLYGLNRSQNIEFKVKINTGVGATNREVQLQAITTAEQTAMQNLQIAMQMQDLQSAKVYRDVLNKLYLEKLAVIGLKNIQNDMKGELDNERNDNDGTGANPAGEVAGNQINQADFGMAGLNE